jgi:hypothetical protein
MTACTAAFPAVLNMVLLQLLRKQIMEVAPRHETQQQIDEANRQIDSIRADVVRQGHTYQVGGWV